MKSDKSESEHNMMVVEPITPERKRVWLPTPPPTDEASDHHPSQDLDLDKNRDQEQGTPTKIGTTGAALSPDCDDDEEEEEEEEEVEEVEMVEVVEEMTEVEDEEDLMNSPLTSSSTLTTFSYTSSPSPSMQASPALRSSSLTSTSSRSPPPTSTPPDYFEVLLNAIQSKCPTRPTGGELIPLRSVLRFNIAIAKEVEEENTGADGCKDEVRVDVEGDDAPDELEDIIQIPGHSVGGPLDPTLRVEIQY